MSNLSEDEIDDILYLARTNERDELAELLKALAAQHSCAHSDILSAAIDPESGNTALHYAGANGHVDILTLLSSLASPPPMLPHLNSPNCAGNTPLHWAALNGHLPFVQALVNLGADASITNSAGHDAVYEAELNGKDEVVGWLLEKANGLEKGITGNVGEADGEGLEGANDEVGEVSERVEKMDANGPTKSDLR